jgi:hypothetical protein
MSGFSQQEADPHESAWAFLNEPVAFELPTFTMPDLPPEPSFMIADSWQSPDARSRNADYGSPSFDLSAPPSLGSVNLDQAYAGDTTGIQHGM